ncbi:MAG: AAA family ATPase [Steroidobacter sp.]|nr:AAA family ATPase [Steroidobacter sp.]
MTSLLALIETKLVSPHRQPDELELPTAAEVLEGIYAAIAGVNRMVQRHNGLMDSFQEEQHRALTAIKGHLLGRAQATFDELKATAEDASKKLSEANEGREALTRRREFLQSAMRSHGPAAEVITRLIHNYLGRRDLELVAAENGYRLRRNGKLVRGSLSEGEKTAIAICYFIITLEAEGRKRKDLIVIVDDPVSSLDTRALNYSFSILRAVVAEAGQVFILTHNLHFMNEVRKWLGSKTERGLKRDGKDPSKVAAALLFLDTVQPGGPETRACRLRELPKHIRDYESEYHYLVHLILRFASDPDESEYFFLLPNALRKVMDVFLAFRMPGPDGLGSKVNRLAGELEGSGIDPARIQALERLAQMESHADNLDDLVTFSNTTVEEVRAAAETLIELISTLDPRHWQTMKGLCG